MYWVGLRRLVSIAVAFPDLMAESCDVDEGGGQVGAIVAGDALTGAAAAGALGGVASGGQADGEVAFWGGGGRPLAVGYGFIPWER